MSAISVAGVQLSVAALTDPGLVRARNEDSFMADGPAFVVADGMGGYERGDEASAAVIAAFTERLSGNRFGEFSEVSAALIDADDSVALVAQGTARGAGSTATGAVLVSDDGRPHWLIFNVGDSRVYVHRGSQLWQVTVDHSLARELIDAGELAVEDLENFRDRGVITRAFGTRDSSADSWLLPVVNGQRLLLCSDGLYNEVDDESIRAVLTMNGRPEAVAEVLIGRAKAHGGRDNITVVVVDVLSGGMAPGDHPSGTFSSPDVEDTVTV